MNALHGGGAWSRYGRGRASNRAVLFVLLKTYGQSFVRGEITHSSRARDTARLFYRYAYMARRRVYQPANRGRRKDGRKAERKEDSEQRGRGKEKEEQKKELGQHYPAIKSLG